MNKPYKVIGVYDSETCNVNDDSGLYAFPILHQLGILKDSIELENITPDNVEDFIDMHLFRHTVDLYTFLDDFITIDRDYVPVICCHNLSFDMWPLAQWLNSHEVKVLAKSCQKPITFTILDENSKPALVIWDTLIFSQQALSKMGENCGYTKAIGQWDYNLIRTPETPLTDDEIDYAKRDIYTLFAWLSWWLKHNPDIDACKLGFNVVTKTGVVRERMRKRFDCLKSPKAKYNVGRFQYFICRQNKPKSDDELFTMIACTRGGLTFCSSRHASVVFELKNDNYIFAYDATSMHPSHIVSHRYPICFHKTTSTIIELCFDNIVSKKIEYILKNWSKPFNTAVLGLFEFVNLRPKEDTLFSKNGIYPLASARFKSVDEFELREDNQDAQEFEKHLENNDYRDKAVNPVFEFGKLVKADKARIFLTELAIWEVAQAYTWDSMRAISGYITGKFVRPSDMMVISVMQFYNAKNEFKRAIKEYSQVATISNGKRLRELNIPDNVVSGMENGSISEIDVSNVYLGLKADLNALFGISATNEYRRDTILNDDGIGYEGDFGLCNAPKNSKAWYQFGQRIVGWSRIQQIIAMQLIEPFTDCIINGDTDSIKFKSSIDNLDSINSALSKLHESIDIAKKDNCSRVKAYYPTLYNSLEFIGHYEKEFQTQEFCASWNKAYCMHDNKGFSFTIAGLPTYRGINEKADELYNVGMPFSEVVNLFLGYNVTYSFDLIRLNQRIFPKWGKTIFRDITDYLGNTSKVVEPSCIALYPMAKTINNTDIKENKRNCSIAKMNNSNVNIENVVITRHEIVYPGRLNEI